MKRYRIMNETQTRGFWVGEPDLYKILVYLERRNARMFALFKGGLEHIEDTRIDLGASSGEVIE